MLGDFFPRILYCIYYVGIDHVPPAAFRFVQHARAVHQNVQTAVLYGHVVE